MEIFIKILIWIISLIMLFLGGYLWLHRKKPFITFHPEKIHSLSVLLTIMSILLLAGGILTILISFSAKLMVIIGVLLTDVVIVSVLSFILIGYAIS